MESNDILEKQEVEQWSHWIPCQNLEHHYYCDFLYTTPSTTTIGLSSSNKTGQQVIIRSNSFIHCFRIDESYTYKLLEHLYERYGKTFVTTSTFFKIINSPQKAYFLSSNNEQLNHYVIFTLCEILHLIVKDEPLVTVTKEAKK